MRCAATHEAPAMNGPSGSRGSSGGTGAPSTSLDPQSDLLHRFGGLDLRGILGQLDRARFLREVRDAELRTARGVKWVAITDEQWAFLWRDLALPSFDKRPNRSGAYLYGVRFLTESNRDELEAA